MRSTHIIFLLSILVSVSGVAEDQCDDCWWEPPPAHYEDDSESWYGYPSIRRHHYAMTIGLPASYLALQNQLAPNEKNLQRGRQLYEKECAHCHGLAGYGDGEFARELTPRPASLAQLANISMMSSDGYIYWTIAEGGAPIESSMPAYKDKLTARQIWALITYLRHDLSK